MVVHSSDYVITSFPEFSEATLHIRIAHEITNAQAEKEARPFTKATRDTHLIGRFRYGTKNSPPQ
jgi:hypothetical protein